MKHILLVQNPNGLWEEVFSGGFGEDSRNKCMDKSTEIPDSKSWMIVALVRAHSGTETMEIKG